MRSTIHEWRRLYEAAAEQPEWLRAHRWGYSPDVALRTIADIREKLAPQPGDRILEVGCGCGMVLSHLVRDGRQGFGVDFCAPLLRSAERLGVDRRCVRLAAAEAARLPFADQVFDRVLCYSVFQCFPKRGDAERALTELLRVCKPGGTVLVGDVFGVVHTLRAVWQKNSWSIETVRAALRLPPLVPVRWALFPVRAVSRWLRKLAGRQTSEARATLRRRHYSQRFFRKLGERYGCRVEVLPQHIAGRDISRTRFDVRLRKANGKRADDARI